MDPEILKENETNILFRYKVSYLCINFPVRRQTDAGNLASAVFS